VTSTEIPLLAVQEANEQSTSNTAVDDYTLFTYPNYMTRTYNTLNLKDKDTYSVRAYYLDEITPSTQALMRAIKYSQNPTGIYKVFLSTYDNVTDAQLTTAYPYTYNIGANLFREFCKYIYRCHINSIIFPVFTVTFDLSLSQHSVSQSLNTNTRYQIFEMCMKNGVGAKSSSCVNGVDYSLASFAKNANILSGAFTRSQNNECFLEFSTSRQNCTFTQATNADIMRISLPVMDTAATAKTFVTMTPYKLHVFMCWPKPMEGLQWVYSEKTIAPGNDFESLFAKKNLTENTLADIDIMVVPQLINQVNEVKLGYKNFALELKKYM
jgi:hypothetical protein